MQKIKISLGNNPCSLVENYFNFYRIVQGTDGSLYFWELFYGSVECKKIIPLFQNNEICYYRLKKHCHLVIKRKESQIICAFFSEVPETQCYFYPQGYDFVIAGIDNTYLFLHYCNDKYVMEEKPEFPEQQLLWQNMKKIYQPEENNPWKILDELNDSMLQKLAENEDY